MIRLDVGLGRILIRSLGSAVFLGLILVAAPVDSEDEIDLRFPGPDAPLDVGCQGVSECLDSTRCGTCHEAIAEEWSASLHRASWTDPIFQESFAIEPRAECRHCHAPLSPRDTLPTGIANEQGVSCVVCHVREGTLVASRDASSTAPHPVRAASILQRSEYCAGCHQFDFPTGVPDHRDGLAMQDTFEEWVHSRAAPCQSCHMPRVGEGESAHGSHAFPGISDPEFLQRAVEVRVRGGCNAATKVVEFELEAMDVGHAVPTGDLFRRLELAVEGEGGIYRRAFRYARSFTFEAIRVRRPDATTAVVLQRREVEDTRLVPGEVRRVAVDLPSTMTSIEWSLDHLIMVSPDAPLGEEPRRRTPMRRGHVDLPPCR